MNFDLKNVAVNDMHLLGQVKPNQFRFSKFRFKFLFRSFKKLILGIHQIKFHLFEFRLIRSVPNELPARPSYIALQNFMNPQKFYRF